MKALIFDTETSALIDNSLKPLKTQPQIVELFGLMLDDNEAEDKPYHWMIHLGKPLPKETITITGITDEMLVGKPLFAAVAEEIISVIESADRVVAHNLSYDMGVTNFEVKRLVGRAPIRWPKSRICTVESSECYLGYRLNLSSLHEHLFGEAFTGAHRAEADVRALARCYKEMVKRGDI